MKAKRCQVCGKPAAAIVRFRFIFTMRRRPKAYRVRMCTIHLQVVADTIANLAGAQRGSRQQRRQRARKVAARAIR